MDRWDVKKEYAHLYAPKNKVWQQVTVPPLTFVAVDGQGDPNTSDEYTQAVQALFSVSYALKFFSKKVLNRDYVVPPLEGLWTAEGHEGGVNDKSLYRWTMMVMLPEWISEDMFEQVRAEVAVKKKLPALPKLRCETLNEGLSYQVLHVGSYDAEAPTIALLHGTVLPDEQLVFNGLHHEIYLGDPRRTSPEKLKTVLRQPVRRA